MVEVFDSDGFLRSEERIVLERRSMREWSLPVGVRAEAGGVVVTSDGGLTGFLRFRHEQGAAASVGASPLGSRFTIPTSKLVDQVGLAIYNDGDEEERVILAIGDSSNGASIDVTIPPKGSLADFVEGFFQDSSVPLGGLLNVSSFPSREVPDGRGGYEPKSRISVLAMEVVNGNLVTLPAVLLK